MSLIAADIFKQLYVPKPNVLLVLSQRRKRGEVKAVEVFLCTLKRLRLG